ncbi:DUF4418 family protein [Anoxybacterium hadale]|uniref:DUF4418 family protein n=1 Tax=Anoxybacterium hadale TaxID=3408580 RepID=A0ACD1AA75_9FIRM|nr:DUF4418 family protein [Clostridiales bacterium]
MKNRIITGLFFLVTGLLISLGPTYLFKVCEAMGDDFMKCHWTARAEIGIGLLIAVLGVISILVSSLPIRLGLHIGAGLTGILAASVPTVLIGVCAMPGMNCHAIAAPSILVISLLVIIVSVVNSIYLIRQNTKNTEEMDQKSNDVSSREEQ